MLCFIGNTSLVTALGNECDTIHAIENNQSGLYYSEKYNAVVGEIPARAFDNITSKVNFTKFESLIIQNIKNVLPTENDIDDDTLLVISTTKGNVHLLENNTAVIDNNCFLYTSAIKIADYLKFKRKPIVISNACISGVSAFVVAKNLMSSDDTIKNVVVVGCDILSEFIVEGFRSFKSLSNKPCKPYDANRDGLSLGEACGAVLLTKDINLASKPLIALKGGAVTNDANHISGPSRTGDGLYYAMKEALNDAEVLGADVKYVNMHGTATLYNDEMESKAIQWSCLSNVPVNSFKGYIGHTLGASGVVETILCIYQMRNNIVFATKGFEKRGTPCKLNVSDANRLYTDVNICLKTASGFGGCNAAIVLVKNPVNAYNNAEKPNASIGGEDNIKVLAQYSLPNSSECFSDFIRKEYKQLNLSYMKFYKMSDLSKALFIASENIIRQCPEIVNANPRRVAIIMSNKVSSLEADIQHQQIVDKHLEEGASPAIFVYTLPNVAVGEVCIKNKIKGDNTFFIENFNTGLSEYYAKQLLRLNKADFVICGWCDKEIASEMPMDESRINANSDLEKMNGINKDNNWNVNLKILSK